MSTDQVSAEQVSAEQARTEQTGPAAELVAAAAQMRVVRGAPDDLEVAALVAGLVAVASSGADTHVEPPQPGQWTRRSRPRAGLPTGGDSWRWSLR